MTTRMPKASKNTTILHSLIDWINKTILCKSSKVRAYIMRKLWIPSALLFDLYNKLRRDEEDTIFKNVAQFTLYMNNCVAICPSLIKESFDKIQTMYNRTYRLKGRIVRTMPNEVMWSSKNRCGMDWVNFWDEISIDRTVAWMKHANSGRCQQNCSIGNQKIRRNCSLIETGIGANREVNVGWNHAGTNRGMDDWRYRKRL